ncbi:MAG: hypothetical protein FJ286_10835 [Planctomycetes bacterium]|nr:hypothetical protein [Planctomycetota bacterium]
MALTEAGLTLIDQIDIPPQIASELLGRVEHGHQIERLARMKRDVDVARRHKPARNDGAFYALTTGTSSTNASSGSTFFDVPWYPAGNGNWNDGWVQIGHTSTGLTFGNGAVKTTVNTTIASGAVSEIDLASAGSAVSLVAGVLAMVEQRRRRRFAAAGSLAD